MTRLINVDHASKMPLDLRTSLVVSQLLLSLLLLLPVVTPTPAGPDCSG
jgi:hypothetical protein